MSTGNNGRVGALNKCGRGLMGCGCSLMLLPIVILGIVAVLAVLLSL